MLFNFSKTIKTIVGFFLFCSIHSYAQNYTRFYEQGLKEYNQKNYYQAAKLFEESHSMIPEITTITYKIAEALYFAHDYERSLIYFTEVIENSPGQFPQAYYYQADLQKMLKKYADARSSFKYFYHTYSSEKELHKKAEKQIQSCDYAIKNSVNQPVLISKIASPINSSSSEISIAEFGDSIVLYSTMTPNKDSSDYIAKMFVNKHVYEYESLINVINGIGLNSIDISIASDKKTAFFCACTDTVGSTDFKIYKTVYDSMKWMNPELLPQQINLDSYRSTQPQFTRINGNEYLFFVSDRPGGQGGLDIWYSQWQNNRFSQPVNAGIEINTIGDDITPFYDTVSQKLYFSSEFHKGYGGFDIFYSKGIPGNWSQAVNLGLPYNSSFNDSYFAISQNRKRGYFTSDRDPILIDDSKYYFNDFYCFYNKADTNKNIHLQDSLLLSKTYSTVQNQPIQNTDELKKSVKNKQLDPVFNLYFDHNQPDRNSMVQKNYEQLLTEYSIMPESHQKEINDLHIEQSYSQFTKELNTLLDIVAKGKKITIQLRAFTSPSGSKDYNKQLADRRIEMVEQLLKSFKNGALIPFIDKSIHISIQDPEIPVLNTADIEEQSIMAARRKVEIKFVPENK